MQAAEEERMFTRPSSCITAGLGVLLSLAPAAAVTISTGPTMGSFISGGWNGSYYADPTDPGSVATAQTFISSNAATATFFATDIDYGVSDSPTQNMTMFFGSNASGLNPASAGSNLVEGGILDLKGYIDVTSVGSPLNFSLSSDDGSELFIAGTLVINNDGEHSGGFVTPVSVTFTGGTGFYPVELVYFENFSGPGQLGLAGSSFTGATNCTLCGFTPPGGDPLTASANLFTLQTASAPEPVSLAMVIGGLFALAIIRRSRT
jgi:hypothetical protein